MYVKATILLALVLSSTALRRGKHLRIPNQSVNQTVARFRATLDLKTMFASPAALRVLPIRDHKSRPLQLIFFTDPVPWKDGGEISEALWIRDTLLSKVGRPVHMKYVGRADRMRFFTSDALIVGLYFKFRAYVKMAKAAGVTNVGYFDMGDEQMKKDTAWYSGVDYVFRNYYNAKYLKTYSNLLWVPEGIRSGLQNSYVPSTIALASHRATLCNFAGSLRADRKEMVDVVKRENISCDLRVSTWESATSLHSMYYRILVENSKFTLCPSGNNPESLRLYEALELGSIPILKRYSDPSQDVLGGLGDVPFPVVDRWDELPAVFTKYAGHEAVDQLQAQVVKWWTERKETLLTTIAFWINRNFEKYYG